MLKQRGYQSYESSTGEFQSENVHPDHVLG